MNTRTKATILHQITMALSSREPKARALARSILAEIEVPAELIEQARVEIAAEARALALMQQRPQPPKLSDPERKAKLANLMAEQGPALWQQWHRRALTHTGNDTAFIMELATRLPCGDCRKHFVKLIEDHPPVFGEGYFDYTVMAHNLVSARLGKPLVTPANARLLYPPA